MVKKALCCGLNYPNQRYQLFGCINDCLDWEHLLKNTFQFDETRVLIDQNPDGTLCTAPTQIPTRANILAQLGGWLCAGNEPGDCLVFVFAGHGCQVRDGYGQVDEALVPEDFDTQDEQGGQPLVMDDELHALFARLPAGCFLTVVLDCCHGSHMLDVPCTMDASVRPPKIVQVSERPREVHNRTDEAWQKALISHAMARPRFVPTITATGPRQKRTPEGAGAHVGRMTLDPGVTAFCFAASRTPEIALDANIKAHQRGVMSFCLIEALAALRNRCTYEMLLEKAQAKMDDIRDKYMPTMDQYIDLSFCPNSAPSEVVVLDARYARVAQHRLTQRARSERGQSGDGLRSADGCPTPVRESSTEFVPSPVYNPPDRGHPGQSSGGPPPGPPTGTLQSIQSHQPPTGSADTGYRGHSAPQHGSAMLYLVIHAGYNLLHRDAGMRDGCDPYAIARVGHQEHRTPTISNTVHPVWHEGNHLTFHVGEREAFLELEVMTGYNTLGRASVDIRSLPPGQWHRRREMLRDGQDGEVEFDVRLEPPQGHQPPSHSQQSNGSQQAHGGHGPPTHSQQSHQSHGQQQPPPVNHHSLSPSRQRPPSPVRQDLSRPPYPDHGPVHHPYPDHGPVHHPGMASDGAYSGAAGPGPPPQLPPQLPAPALPECGGNLFGTPNLFGAMPNLMSNMFGGAGGMPGAAPGPLGQPAGAMPMPGRPVSGQMPGGAPLGVTYPAPGAGPPAQAGRGLNGAPPGAPTATLGIDINLNGRTDLVISGPDLNRDGIPDILQQGGCQAQPQGFGSAPGFPGQAAYGAGPGAPRLPTGAAPMPTGVTPMPTGVTPMPAGATPMPTGATPVPTGVGPMHTGAYGPPPGARGAPLGGAPMGAAFPANYGRGARLY